MKLHRWSNDELKQSPYRVRNDGRRHHKRRSWTFYKNEEDQFGQTVSIETLIQPQWDFSARFHVGNRGSETPWDGHLIIFGCGAYWSYTDARKFADWITSRKANPHAWCSRDLKIYTHDSRLWYDLWTDQSVIDRIGNKAYPKWRHGVLKINPIEWIWGSKRYNYVDLELAVVPLSIPESEESVIAKVSLQCQTFKRTKSRRVISEKFILDVDVDSGIPLKRDGTNWSRSCVHGFGVGWPENRYDPKTWQKKAKGLIEAWVIKERAKQL